MTSNQSELILGNEVYEIVGAAMEVSNELGSGILEGVYQEALGMEFRRRRIPCAPQQRLRIAYKDQSPTKEYIADFVCFEQIIVEGKAIDTLTGNNDAQVLNYLSATGLPSVYCSISALRDSNRNGWPVPEWSRE